MKNKITLYTGFGSDKKKVELYNFNKLDHIQINDQWNIRIECDGRFYYFQQWMTSIGEIEIYA